MTQTLSPTRAGFSDEAFSAFLAHRREPSWLLHMRREAWDRFRRTPLPQTSQEQWRRTDLRLLHLERFGLPGGGSREQREDHLQRVTQLPEALLENKIDLAGELILLDGEALHHGCDRQMESAGVQFGPLSGVLQRDADRLRSCLEQPLVSPATDKFSALAAAGWCDGAALLVPAGVRIGRPLYVGSYLSPEATQLQRILVVLEEGAEATVLVETASTEPQVAGLHCGIMEVVLQPGAKLNLVSVQNWNRATWHFSHETIRLAAGAQLRWTVAGLGGRLAKVNQHVELSGPDASANVHGVMFTEGKQHLCYCTLQHHRAAGCHSNLLYKGALQDRSHLVWRGMIRVDHGAQKTDAYQRNDNLMLARTARADSIPGLEILAHDVRCSHGATVGRVDDEQLFYLGTRGLARSEAARLIVDGFFQQVFDRIAVAPIRAALAEAIARRVRQYA